jgi:GNAT superfamily N-acetyltransferase
MSSARKAARQEPHRSDVKVAVVTPERWTDLADLFGRRGPRGGFPMTAGCWCMWWRRRTGNPERNRAAMRKLVRGGREPGLLAYEDERPVGWVSVAPRAEFGQLVSSRIYRPVDEEDGVWAIVCFYVDRSAKRRGVATALLQAAVAHAFDRGAGAVEGYPHAAGDYMGSIGMFAEAGFERVRPVGKRVLMRRAAAS